MKYLSRGTAAAVSSLVSTWLVAGCASAPPQAPAVSPAASLVGTWQVDLRPEPSAPPYYQPMEVTQVEGGRFSGSFYGAPFKDGRINADWGPVRIAFVTADATVEYHHSATLVDGRLEGLTHAPGRGFLAVWRAQKR